MKRDELDERRNISSQQTRKLALQEDLRMSREKLKRRQAVIERQEKELEGKDKSLEAAAAGSQYASTSLNRAHKEAHDLKVTLT